MKQSKLLSADTGSLYNPVRSIRQSLFSNLQFNKINEFKQLIKPFTLVWLFMTLTVIVNAQESLITTPASVGNNINICEGGQVSIEVAGTVSGRMYSLVLDMVEVQQITSSGSNITFNPVSFNTGGNFSMTVGKSASPFVVSTRTINVYADPTAPTLTLSEPEGMVCAGTGISATAGTVGTDSDPSVPGTPSYQFSLDNGGTWAPYTLGTVIPTSTYAMSPVKIKAIRSNASGCYAERIYTWTIDGNVHNVAKGKSYCTIQQAINDASTVNGDVLTVDAGAYTDPINVTKSVTLRGPNYGVNANNPADITMINGLRVAEAVLSTTNMKILANNVIVDGLKFTGESNVNTDGTPANVADGLSIINNVFEDLTKPAYNNTAGVLAQTNITFSNNRVVGINFGTVSALGAWAGVSNMTINANYFAGFERGIQFDGVSDITVSNNHFANFITKGLQVANSCSNINITGNVFDYCTTNPLADQGAIRLYSNASGNININNNVFSNNNNAVRVSGAAFSHLFFKINNNTFNSTNTKAISDGTPGSSGLIDGKCNFFTTTDYTTILSKMVGRVVFTPYKSTAASTCDVVNALPKNLNITYNALAESILVKFDVDKNDLQLTPISGSPTLVQIQGLYADLATALAGTDPLAIQAAALAVGDDIITEYYYMNGTTKVYLKTSTANNLIKNKYWAGYLIRASDNVNFPNWGSGLTLINQTEFRTNTNPLTVVSSGWLDEVAGRDLIVKVTFIHNGAVNSIEEAYPIPGGHVNVYSMEPTIPVNLVSNHTTIQSAINAATTLDGYIVKVDAGTYNEGQLLVNKELTLLGANSGTAGNGSRVAESVVTDSYVLISKDNVTIDGFKFTGTPSTYPVHSAQIGNGPTGGPKPSNGVIKNNFFENVANNGIFLTQVDNWNIEANRFQGIGNITGNLGTPVYSAMSLYYGVTNVTIKDNVLHTVDYNGILLNHGDFVTITNNNFTNIQMSGVQLSEACGNVTVSGNTFTNANVIDQADRGAIRIYGQLFDGPINFTGNTITGGVAAFAVKSGNNITGKDIHFNNNSITGSTSGTAIRHMGTGILDATCNWYGSTDYTTVDSKITGKVVFVPYSTSVGNCNGSHAVPANLNAVYTQALENIVVNFDVTVNDLQLLPIPGLNPAVPADFTAIKALYAALDAAIIGGVPATIQSAALAVGDDVITEYYYYTNEVAQTGKTYLQTASMPSNDLVKNKYWQEYLIKTSNPAQKYPKWTPTALTLVDQNELYTTSTNPLTGAVSAGWLNPVLGKNLIVKVTFVHNGAVNSIEQSIPIARGPVNVYNGATWVSSHTSIQAAVDASSNGNEIRVDAGIYAENAIVNKSVTILGPNANVDPCSGTRVAEAIVVPGTNAVSSGEVFHVAASGVTISGFTIDGDNPSLPVNGYGFGGADMHAAEGVTSYETGVNNLTISKNIFKNLSYFGVTLYDYPAGVPSTGHLISNNKFQDLGTYDATSGIANWGGGVLIYNNQYANVENNCMTNVRLGVQTGNFSQANPGTSTYQSIAGNNIQSRRAGIFHNLHYGTASPITLANNNLSTLANANETSGWRGILLGSLGGTVTSFVTDNMISGLGSSLPTVEGINIWNCQSNPIIKGGTISDVKVGINVNNYEGYSSNANPTSAIIDGVTITTASVAGITINDNTLNTNNATVSAEIKGNTSIIGSPVGVLVKGSDASANIHNNLSSIHGNVIGIDVDGGSSVVTLNHIYDNVIGIRFTNSGSGTVETNKFEGATSNGTDIQATATAGSVTATQNNWFAGTTYGLENLSGTAIDATKNYWNATNGPSTVGVGSGANVTTNVTYCPILSDTPMAFGGTGTELYGPTALSYTPSTNVYTEGMVIAPLSPTITGTAPFTYTVSSLPAGISISSTTGLISGTPTAPTTSSIYTVTATNSCGSTSTTLTITVDAIPFVGGDCNLLNEDFTTNPQLANTNVNGAWYPDRYRPASFIADAGKLKIEINAVDGAQLRPTAYSSGFYNTQGRKINQCSGCVTVAKADLYIPADWATNKRRSDLWATGYDASNAITAYPIIGFRNVTGSNPQMSVYDVILGTWNELGAPSLGYNTSYTLETRLNGVNLEYLINGAVVATYSSNGSVYFGNIILQAYNFNDNTLGASYDGGSNNSYYALWDNVITTGNNGNIVTNSTTGNTYCSIQGAIDAASINDVINVGAGTYTENVIVNKSLTINGPNAVIDPCSGTRLAEAIVVPAVEDWVNGAVVFYINPNVSNVTISGFTIDGDNTKLTSGVTGTNGADIDAAEAISTYETGVNGLTITNNIIQNFAYFGVTLYDFVAGVPSSGHVISNNKIQNLGTYIATGPAAWTNFWGGGILIYNNSYAKVENNCMTNVRLGVQTGNFYQANPGAAATISNNMIEARRMGVFHNLHYGATTSPINVNTNTITALNNTNETRWYGIEMASLSNPGPGSSAFGNIINGSGTAVANVDGFNVWNCQATTTISGGTITDVKVGINVNNYEGYTSNANHTSAVIDGVMISNATSAGVMINDNALNTNNATVSAEVKNSTITNSTIGILLSGADAGGNMHNNTITSGLIGIQANGTITSLSNSLTINNNIISNINKEVGSAPTRGIVLSDITGSVPASIASNSITGPFYGYGVYHLNTTPVTTLDADIINGVMQGVAIFNTDGVNKKPSNVKLLNTNMSDFTGTAGTAANMFHAGIYTFTIGGTLPAEGITLDVSGVTIDGTQTVTQSSGGIYLADFSGGSTNVQTVTINESNIINNTNRGLDARGKVNAIVTNSTFTNNGGAALGTGGNNGITIIAQQGATVNATNNFISHPASSTSPVTALLTGTGSASTIIANNNSILMNGNTSNGKGASNISGSTIDAKCNWWGLGVCPSDLVAGTVAIYPYLINGVDGDGAAGFQPVGTCTNANLAIQTTVTSPVMTYNETMTSGDAEFELTICSGQEVTTSPVTVVNLQAANCNSLRVQTKYTTDITTLTPMTQTFDLAYTAASLLPPTVITPENHDGIVRFINFESFAYYDVNGNNQYDSGIDVASELILFKLTVQPTPVVVNTITGPISNIPMSSGGTYNMTICSGEEVTTSDITSSSVDPSSCGPLWVQTTYLTDISTLPNTLQTFNAPVTPDLGSTSITPENHDGMAKDIVFVSTPYYDVDGSGTLTSGDVVGLAATFTLTVQPTPKVNFTVTAGGNAIAMESGLSVISASYAATICSGDEVSSTAVMSSNLDPSECGPLMIQTSYTTKISNISPMSYTAYTTYNGNVAPTSITPQNLGTSPGTIIFTTTPYYEVDGMAGLTAGDIIGDYPAIFTLTVLPTPVVAATITGPSGPIAMSSDNSYNMTICSGQQVTTSDATSTSDDSNVCGVLMVQTTYLTDISTLPNTLQTFNAPITPDLGSTSITPENHDGMAKDIVFVSTPYYDVDGSGTLTLGDVVGKVITFTLTVQSTPRINFTVTADGSAIPMESGLMPISASYAATICSGEEVSSTAVFSDNPAPGACGPLMIQTSYVSTVPNISPATYTAHAPFNGNVAPASITPQNLDVVPRTIVFTTTPYYEVDNITGLTAGDIVGDYPVVFTLTVNPAPRITCPPSVTVSNDPTLCNAVVGYADPTFTDFCATSILTRTAGLASGSTFPVGVSTITWQITDGATIANTATCSFTVTVNDTQAPVSIIPSTGGSVSGYICGETITFNSDVLACGTSKTIVKPIWSDNCGIMSTTVSAMNGVNAVTLSDFGTLVSGVFPVGITAVSFVATDIHGNTNTCILNIRVNDVSAPIITNCPTNITVTAPAGACSLAVFWQPPTVSDYCPGFSVVTSHFPGTSFTVGQTTAVTYTATDGSGNTSICTFNVTVNGTCTPANADLSLSYVVPFNTVFNTGQEKDIIISLTEVNAVPTVGTIQFLVQQLPGFTFTFNPTQTTAYNLLNPLTPVNNSDWVVVPFGSGLLFTSTVVVPANGDNKIALKLTAIGSNNSNKFNSLIFPGSGSDNNAANNSRLINITTN